MVTKNYSFMLKKLKNDFLVDLSTFLDYLAVPENTRCCYNVETTLLSDVKTTSCA